MNGKTQISVTVNERHAESTPELYRLGLCPSYSPFSFMLAPDRERAKWGGYVDPGAVWDIITLKGVSMIKIGDVILERGAYNNVIYSVLGTALEFSIDINDPDYPPSWSLTR